MLILASLLRTVKVPKKLHSHTRYLELFSRVLLSLLWYSWVLWCFGAVGWATRRTSIVVHCPIQGTQKVKVKVKVHTLDIAPIRSESPLQKRSGMAHVLKGFHSFTCTPTSSSAIGMSRIPAFAFPAITGTHLPIPEGWKAEYTLVRSSPGRDSNLEPATSQLQIRHSTTQPLAHRPASGSSAPTVTVILLQQSLWQNQPHLMQLQSCGQVKLKVESR